MTKLAAQHAILPGGRSQDGYLYCDVYINGKGPFKIVVDTGCSVGLFVTGKTADAAGLRPRGSGFMVGFSGQDRARLADAGIVECGPLHLHGVQLVVGDDDTGQWLGERGIDGLAGLPLFRDVILVLNFPGHRVEAYEVDAWHRPDHGSVKYRPPLVTIPLNIAGGELPALVDTGNAYPLMVPGWDRLLFLRPPVETEGLGAFGIGDGQGRRQRFGQLRGEATFCHVSLVDPPVFETPPKQAANIGVGALDHQVLALDPLNHRLYFCGEETVRKWPVLQYPTSHHRAGYLGVILNGGVRLLEVDTGGALDRAGLKAGDVIVRVDGQPAEKFQMHHEWEAVSRRTLVVRRRKKQATVVVDFSDGR